MVSKPKDHPPVKWALQINTTIFRVQLRTISQSPIELMPLLIDDHPEISSGLTKVAATKVVTARNVKPWLINSGKVTPKSIESYGYRQTPN
jgi:hypothetical protein